MLLRDAILNEYFFASNESISMVSVFVVSIQEQRVRFIGADISDRDYTNKNISDLARYI